MDGLHLLLEFVEVGSGGRKVSCSAPAAEESLSYVHLGPAGMANGADEAGRIVKALHCLIVHRTESPHIPTTAEVMWTGEIGRAHV